LVLLAVGCAQTEGTTIGVVTGVEGSLTEIVSFTVLSSGTEISFVPIEGTEYEFPLAHLREHQRTGELLVVDWELRDTFKYAISLTDG
jgi:hypothetical protein